MEFEIGDDPQGLIEMPDGDRKGGIGDERLLFWQEGNTGPAGAVATSGMDPLPNTQLGERV